MNNKKNVAIGKIGKSIKFKGIDIATGGGADIVWYSMISRCNPEWNFYFVGPNELNKLTEEEYNYIFPNHNVFSAYTRKKTIEESYPTTIEYFKENNITIDFAVLLMGLHADKAIQGFLIKEDTQKPYKLLCCFGNYSGPYVYFLNHTMCPWYSVAEDARYITLHCKDGLNKERMCFSQINTELTTPNHIIDADHRVITKKTQMQWTNYKVKVVYSAFERMFLNGLADDWKDRIDLDEKLESNDNNCMILSNGCGTGQIDVDGNNSSRYDTYKKYIIDNFKGTEYDNTMIYGSWDKFIYEQEPRIQNRKLIDLGEEISKTKYTLVYSQIPGFVTIKPWEMITLGIIPFLHPDYDKYNLLGLPEYIYLKDEKDFLNKMRELDANPELYKKVFNDCLSCITDDFIDGSYINNFIFGNIANDLGFKYGAKSGVKSLFNRFEKNLKK